MKRFLCTDAVGVFHQRVLIILLVCSVSHGKLQGPCTPWKLLPGGWSLVDRKAFALAPYPQEQESGLQSSGQQSLAAPAGAHRELRHSLFLFCG